MRVLLDTHVFLWWITDDPRLSELARRIIGDGYNEVLFSAGSGWEIAIKARLGRIELPGGSLRFIIEQIEQNAFQVLPIQLVHALQVYHLPPHHRDPFDRILIAQSQVEGIPILTADRRISRYDVQVLW